MRFKFAVIGLAALSACVPAIGFAADGRMPAAICDFRTSAMNTAAVWINYMAVGVRPDWNIYGGPDCVEYSSRLDTKDIAKAEPFFLNGPVIDENNTTLRHAAYVLTLKSGQYIVYPEYTTETSLE